MDVDGPAVVAIPVDYSDNPLLMGQLHLSQILNPIRTKCKKAATVTGSGQDWQSDRASPGEGWFCRCYSDYNEGGEAVADEITASSGKVTAVVDDL